MNRRHAIVLLAGGLAAACDRREAETPPPITLNKRPTTRERSIASDILSEASRTRVSSGASPLIEDFALSDIGRRHAQDMAARGFFGHDTPEGRNLLDRTPVEVLDNIAQKGIAENLWKLDSDLQLPAREYARRAIKSWLESPGHRETLLNPRYEAAGVGVAASGRQILVAMIFADGL